MKSLLIFFKQVEQAEGLIIHVKDIQLCPAFLETDPYFTNKTHDYPGRVLECIK